MVVMVFDPRNLSVFACAWLGPSDPLQMSVFLLSVLAVVRSRVPLDVLWVFRVSFVDPDRVYAQDGSHKHVLLKARVRSLYSVVHELRALHVFCSRSCGAQESRGWNTAEILVLLDRVLPLFQHA